MKAGTRRIILEFGIGILLTSILACGRTMPQPTATGIASLPPTEASFPTQTPVPLHEMVSLISISQNETSQKPPYTIKAQIPKLQGSEDARVTNFNDEMTQLTQEEIASFKDNVVQIQSQSDSSGSFYDQQYKLFSPPGNLVSLRFQIMLYIQGAAHPGTHSRTVTYDLEAGSDVKLAQLFQPGSDYLERIANYCIAQLKTRNIDFEAFSGGAAPLQENYGNWNITPEGLLITFDEYQVAAYAAGAQEVVVPYTELQSVIDPNGPMGGFLP